MYTMITGATGGLGKAFVEVCARRGDKLLLTGRSEEKLSALADEVKTRYPSVEVCYYAADLQNEGSRYEMTKQIAAEGKRISLLVNAAGADIQKGFSLYTQEKISFQCRANFEGAASMCLFAYQNRAEELQIVNVSSVSGIYPMPYFALYSALKGALTSFSVAIREEWKGEKVKVTAVLPGAMPTREDIKQQIKGQGLWGKLAAKSPQYVAECSLKAVRKNKRKLIPGFWNKVMNVGTRLIPSAWRSKFIASRWKKISKDAF